MRNWKDYFKTGAAYQFVLEGVGNAQQSPFLSRLFDPNQTSLAQFFNITFKTAIAIGAIAAVIRLVYAGGLYMMSDLVSAKGKARTILTNTILGLLLLLSVWLILNQINPDILNLDVLRGVSGTNR